MPIFVFLHGLLGSVKDWSQVRSILNRQNIESIAIDLPAHGEVKQLIVNNFEHCAEYLEQKIKNKIGDRDYILVGYSLGGRLALYYALMAKGDPSHLVGLIVEGANFGLITETEKKLRWHNDQAWAQRFINEPLALVLEDWYQQAVFSHLNRQQRLALISERSLNDGFSIGAMLQATSLAKQPYLGDIFRTKKLNDKFGFYYICGEKDLKFQTIARKHNISPLLINHAGHNAHKEQPQLFAEKLIGIIKKL